MKNFIACLIAFLFVTIASAQVTNVTSTIDYPYGKVHTIVPTLDSGTIAIAVTNNVTYVDSWDLATAADTCKSNITLTVTNPVGLKVGSIIYYEWASGNVARSVTLSTNCLAVTVVGVASKAKMITLMWNGVKWRLIAAQQIN